MPGADSSSEDAADVALVDHQGRAPAYHHGTDARRVVVRHPGRRHRARGLPRARSGVDRRTFAQWATAETTYRLTWPDVDVRVVSTLRVDIGPDGYDVVIEADAYDDENQVGHREWREHLPRQPAPPR